MVISGYHVVKSYQFVQEYGPQGEFYKLSQECFVFKSPGYIYEICPYVNATQVCDAEWLLDCHPVAFFDIGIEVSAELLCVPVFLPTMLRQITQNTVVFAATGTAF